MQLLGAGRWLHRGCQSVHGIIIAAAASSSQQQHLQHHHRNRAHAREVRASPRPQQQLVQQPRQAVLDVL